MAWPVARRRSSGVASSPLGVRTAVGPRHVVHDLFLGPEEEDPVAALLGNGEPLFVVDGDLTVTGSFEWEGIVMVKKESSMAVDYGGNARIHGSLVVLNGSSVFTMPLDGTLKMTYKYSSAGYQSAVYLHALGADGGNEVVEIFAKGSNRNGDQFGGCCQRAFPQGAQMNFFIRTYASSGTPNVYDHYARGHNAPDGTPYARVTRDAAAKYKWTIEFEDLNVESGHRPDWDYNDQVIEVEVEPAPGAVEESHPFEPWWLVAGVHVREDGSFWSNLAGWFRTSQGRRAGIAVPGEDAPLFRTAMWTVETPAFDDDVPVCKKKNKKKWETEYVSMAQATDWIQSGQAKMGACSGNDGNKKVKVCHVPPGNPSNAHTIEIGMSAVDTHLRNHADYLGECSPTSGGGTTGGGTTGGGETGGGGSTGGGSTGGGSTGGETGGGTTGGGNSANAWATCTANTSGRHLCFRMGSNAEVRYSAQAVARLASRLDRIRESARLVTVDHWVGEQE